MTNIAEEMETPFIAQPTSSERLPPPLKWAGGKRWLLGSLAPIFERHREKRLVEPFAGGMAITLGLRPTRALVNDVNPHLINFYHQVRNSLSISEQELRNERDFYFAQRSRFNELIATGKSDTAEAAAIFYYLNRTGFNGLCRFNSKGEFNVPFGRYKTINYVRDFSAYASTFKQWSFTCGDFSKLPVEQEDFLYLDPPYDVEFTKYSKEGFSWSDQARLVEWLSLLRNPMVVSNQATHRVIELYQEAGFEITTVSGPRRISCTGEREPALEMLAFRNL